MCVCVCVCVNSPFHETTHNIIKKVKKKETKFYN